MERALASCIQYSTPSSVKSKEKLTRSFSGRFPGSGGASMWAYRDSVVEFRDTGLTNALVTAVEEEVGEEDLAWPP